MAPIPGLVLELREVADEETHRTATEDAKEWVWVHAGPIHLVDGTDEYTGTPLSYTTFAGAADKKVLLRATPVVTRDDIDVASTLYDPNDGWQIHLTLTAAAAARREEVSRRLVAQTPKGRIAIVLDGRVLSIKTVQSEVGKRIVLTGDMSAYAPPGTPTPELRKLGAERVAATLQRKQ